jgi:two-component system chemotaxis response regulator CheB
MVSGEERTSSKCKTLGRANVEDASQTEATWKTQKKTLICIGTSTGGPRALQTVLSALPKSLKAPIAIVQHMPPRFTKSLAERLNTVCSIKVKEAEEGDILQNGVAYIAPGGKQMIFLKTISGIAISIIESEEVNIYRPSVDVMFQSASDLAQYDKIVVIMTGMGADGAKGLIELKESGNVWAIAESEKSCVVYGMPKAANNTNLVDAVVELNNIASSIVKKLESND